MANPFLDDFSDLSFLLIVPDMHGGGVLNNDDLVLLAFLCSASGGLNFRARVRRAG